ncbi:hypothetical protein [Pararhizobium haloflavum]|uniref:hypothetical protein n=1 Tax=Pararhizobium haloflavum TaxID=2037914 RepID=UPI000C18F027|nr:hypothetical protein [Pararhizobium haloflavum]
MSTTTRRRTFDYNPARAELHVLGRVVRLPRSRGYRIAVGCGLIVGGLLGFLPILGFWMIPVGLLVLSQDFSFIRRRRRSLALWYGRRRAQRRSQ